MCMRWRALPPTTTTTTTTHNRPAVAVFLLKEARMTHHGNSYQYSRHVPLTPHSRLHSSHATQPRQQATCTVYVFVFFKALPSSPSILCSSWRPLVTRVNIKQTGRWKKYLLHACKQRKGHGWLAKHTVNNTYTAAQNEICQTLPSTNQDR